MTDYCRVCIQRVCEELDLSPDEVVDHHDHLLNQNQIKCLSCHSPFCGQPCCGLFNEEDDNNQSDQICFWCLP